MLAKKIKKEFIKKKKSKAKNTSNAKGKRSGASKSLRKSTTQNIEQGVKAVSSEKKKHPAKRTSLSKSTAKNIEEASNVEIIDTKNKSSAFKSKKAKNIKKENVFPKRELRTKKRDQTY